MRADCCENFFILFSRLKADDQVEIDDSSSSSSGIGMGIGKSYHHLRKNGDLKSSVSVWRMVAQSGGSFSMRFVLLGKWKAWKNQLRLSQRTQRSNDEGFAVVRHLELATHPQGDVLPFPLGNRRDDQHCRRDDLLAAKDLQSGDKVVQGKRFLRDLSSELQGL